jgi:hypothetical protein
MANVLPKEKQVAVIAALAEGSSIRSIERMTGINRNTIMNLGVRIGQGCAALFEAAVALHFAYYNLVRTHGSLKMTPAMFAGIERDFWTVSDLVKAAS